MNRLQIGMWGRVKGQACSEWWSCVGEVGVLGKWAVGEFSQGSNCAHLGEARLGTYTHTHVCIVFHNRCIVLNSVSHGQHL